MFCKCIVVEVIDRVTFVFVACAQNCVTCDGVSAGQCEEDGCAANYIYNSGGNAPNNYCVARTYHRYYLTIMMTFTVRVPKTLITASQMSASASGSGG